MLYISQHRHLNDWFNLENVKLSDVCLSIRLLPVTAVYIFTNNFLRIIYSRLEQNWLTFKSLLEQNRPTVQNLLIEQMTNI